jgi:hypothetical protein
MNPGFNIQISTWTTCSIPYCPNCIIQGKFAKLVVFVSYEHCAQASFTGTHLHPSHQQDLATNHLMHAAGMAPKPHGPMGSCTKQLDGRGGRSPWGGDTCKSAVSPYLVPKAWTPYFMAPQTPEQAMRTWQALAFLVNVTEWHSMIMRQQVTKWLTAVCVRVGPVGTNCLKSKLCLTWALSSRAGFWQGLDKLGGLTLVTVFNGGTPCCSTNTCGCLTPQGGRRWGSSSRATPGGMSPTMGRWQWCQTRLGWESDVYCPLEHKRSRIQDGLWP